MLCVRWLRWLCFVPGEHGHAHHTDPLPPLLLLRGPCPDPFLQLLVSKNADSFCHALMFTCEFFFTQVPGSISMRKVHTLACPYPAEPMGSFSIHTLRNLRLGEPQPVGSRDQRAHTPWMPWASSFVPSLCMRKHFIKARNAFYILFH